MQSSISERALKVLVAAALAVGCIAKEKEPETKPDEAPAAAAPAAVPPEPEHAKVAIDASATYTLVGAQSEKCLQPAEAAVSDGARLQISTCNGSKAQSFKMIPIPGDHYSIANVGSDKCLDVQAGSADNGAAIQQFPCHGAMNQQWMFADGGEGTLRLVARNSGKVLDVNDERTVDGTSVSQWDWKSTPNQRFRLKLAGGAAAASKDVPVPAKGKPGKTHTASARP